MKPQRDVPLTTQVCMTFGGFLNQFGWAFFGFGLIFARIFIPMADLSFASFSGELKEIQAEVTEVMGTNLSVNESTVMEIQYHFFDEKGEEYWGFSYKTGSTPRSGEKVTVEYPKGDPSTSRIQGLRNKPMPALSLLVLLFPLIGLVMLIFGFRKTKKVLPLLSLGTLTKGKLVNKERTNTKINEQTVYKFTFEFQDRMGQIHKVSEKTHETHLLEDDVEEPLLYLEDDPSRATLLDALPSSPQFDEGGRIIPASTQKTLKLLLIPMIVIIGHGLWH
jgi:hypothetical protein